MLFYVDGKKEKYNPYNMKKDKEIGEGQEVDAYVVGDQVVKFYKPYCKKTRLIFIIFIFSDDKHNNPFIVIKFEYMLFCSNINVFIFRDIVFFDVFIEREFNLCL